MRFVRIAIVAVGVVLASGCAKAADSRSFAVIPGHIDLARGPDGNTVILEAPEGLIVVDTGRHPEHAAQILAYARARERPVAAILNTHWHLDHTTGNRDVRLAYPGAQVIATNAGEAALAGFLAKVAVRSDRAGSQKNFMSS